MDTEVITVEGLGKASSPHPIQERIAQLHGSQCGFCTPGMVMALYAEVATKPGPQQLPQQEQQNQYHDWRLQELSRFEHAFDGNLCRCTGFRPLLDAAKSFAHPQAQQLILGYEEETDGGDGGSDAGVVEVVTDTLSKCKQYGATVTVTPSPSSSPTLSASGESSTAVSMALNAANPHPKTLAVIDAAGVGDGDGDGDVRWEWYRPNTLNDALQIARARPHFVVIAERLPLKFDGRTMGSGGGGRSSGMTVICPAGIEPLHAMELVRNCNDVSGGSGGGNVEYSLRIGAAVTVSALIEYLQAKLRSFATTTTDSPTRPIDRGDSPTRPINRGDSPTRPINRGDSPTRPINRGPFAHQLSLGHSFLHVMLEQLRKVGGTQARNTTMVGSHILSPRTDSCLVPLLHTVASSLEFSVMDDSGAVTSQSRDLRCATKPPIGGVLTAVTVSWDQKQEEKEEKELQQHQQQQKYRLEPSWLSPMWMTTHHSPRRDNTNAVVTVAAYRFSNNRTDPSDEDGVRGGDVVIKVVVGGVGPSYLKFDFQYGTSRDSRPADKICEFSTRVYTDALHSATHAGPSVCPPTTSPESRADLACRMCTAILVALVPSNTREDDDGGGGGGGGGGAVTVPSTISSTPMISTASPVGISRGLQTWVVHPYKGLHSATPLHGHVVSTPKTTPATDDDPHKNGATNTMNTTMSGAGEGDESPLSPNGGVGGKRPVGDPVMHQSALIQSTGEAVYADDVRSPSGCLHAALVKSTVPHARIVRVDPSPALNTAGVKGYFDQHDLVKREKEIADTAEKVFATGTVTCVGQVIAVVVAVTQELADIAADLVVVEYETLPAILTMEEAIAKSSFFPNYDHVIEDGDPARVLARCAEEGSVVEGEMEVGGQEHFYMEPHALMAVPGENGEMTIVSCTQCTTKTQSLVAGCIGVPRHKVVTKVKRIGGGFGGKEVRSTFTSGALAVAAHKLGVSVRILMSREEDMRISGGRHPFTARYRLGYDPTTARVLACDVELFNNGGNTVSTTADVMNRALFHVINAYHVPHVRVRGRLCMTNLPGNTAFRGFGAPQAMMVCETWMDELALRLGKTVEYVRQANLLQQGDRTPYGQLLQYCPLTHMWGHARKQYQLDERIADVQKFNARSLATCTVVAPSPGDVDDGNLARLGVLGRTVRGIAMVPTMYGINFPVRFLNQSGALVIVYADGSVVVSHSGTEMGQGLNTKIIQIAAQAFGISCKDVYIAETATDKVGNTPPTAASVGSDLNGMAVLDACEQIRERLKPIYAKLGDSAPFSQVATMAWSSRINLSAQGFYATPTGGGYDWSMTTKDNSERGEMFNYFSFGVACSEVELDITTGAYRTIRTDILMDVGQSLNPAIDIGQIEGSFVQGAGWLTTEELLWGAGNERETRVCKDNRLRSIVPGQLWNASPHGYVIPGASDVPLDMRVHLYRHSTNPKAVHSSKAVGEPPFFLSASVFFAIKNAVRTVRQALGKSPEFTLIAPATSERIRQCMGQE